MKRVVLILVAVCLSGCGIEAKIQARQAFQQAAANYNSCLLAHQTMISACDAQKQIMETDEAEYNDFAAGISNGGDQSISVTTKIQ